MEVIVVVDGLYLLTISLTGGGGGGGPIGLVGGIAFVIIELRLLLNPVFGMGGGIKLEIGRAENLSSPSLLRSSALSA